MTKKILSMILAIAMVVSMFAGITISANAADGVYTLVTDAATLSAGDTIILVCPTKNVAAGPMGSGKYFTSVAATVSGSTAASAEAIAITLGGDAENGWTLTTSEGTVATAAAKGMNLNGDGVNTWTIAIADGVATIKSTNTNYGWIQYNSGSPRFVNYASAQTAIAIYKYTEGATVCTHENATSTETAAPTCTEEGSADFSCPDCGETWSETIAALGHDYIAGEVTAPTCTEDGYTTYTCSRCEDVKKDDYVDAGHNYVDGVCTVCGEPEPSIESATFVKVTDVNDLAAEDRIIIVNADATHALSTTQNTNNRAPVEITVNADGSITAASDLVEYISLGKAESGFWTLGVAGGYLYAGSSSSNHLKTQAENDANGEWTIEIADGIATIKAQGANTRNWIRFNSTSNLFACYASGQKDVAIYKETVIVACDHVNTENREAVPADCLNDGYEAGVYCLDCERYIEGGAKIAALGHDTVIALINGEITMTCSRCDAAAVLAVDPCVDATAYTDASVVYRVAGVVTFVNGKEVYIEDATGGLCLYFNSAVSDIALGDYVYAIGTMKTYSGLIEMVPSEYHVLTNGNALPETTVTLAELKADTTNAYLGMRVKVENLEVVTLDSTNTILSDGTNTITWRYPVLAENDGLKETDKITLTAIVSKYNSDYQFKNAESTDYVIEEVGGGVEHETVSIATVRSEANTAKNYDIEGRIIGVTKYFKNDVAYARTIYVYDGTGIISVYFTDATKGYTYDEVAIGSVIHAYGTYSPYKGMHQIAQCDITDNTTFIVQDPDHYEAPVASEVAIADLVADYNNTNVYNPGFVTVTGTVSSISYKADYMTFVLSDGTNSINIYNAPLTTEEGYIVADAYVEGTVYYTEAGGIYTVASISAFEEGMIYYTKGQVTVEYIAVDDTVTVTGVVYAASSEYRINVYDADAIAVEPPCEHEWAADETGEIAEYVAPTCTETGHYVAYCTICGELGETVEIPAIGHNYVDGSCTNCGEADPDFDAYLDEGLTIMRTGINIQAYIGVNYMVNGKVAANYDKYYVGVTVGDREEQILENAPYISTYTTAEVKVAGPEMTNTITAVLYAEKDGVVYHGNEYTYSVRDGIMSLMANPNSDAHMTLMVDMLYYGAAAQQKWEINVDDLATSKLTDEQKAFATTAIPDATATSSTIDNGVNTVSFLNVTASLQATIELQFVVNAKNAGDVSNLEARITYEGKDTADVVELTSYSGYFYIVKYDQLTAAQIRTPINVTIYDKTTGEPVSATYVTSIEANAAKQISNSADLIYAILRYGDSAKAYFG